MIINSCIYSPPERALFLRACKEKITYAWKPEVRKDVTARLISFPFTIESEKAKLQKQVLLLFIYFRVGKTIWYELHNYAGKERLHFD